MASATAILEGNFMLENLRQQRELGKFCDIVLVVGGRRFPAHRCVLAASSPFFESVLKNHRVTKEEIYIEWDDLDTFEVLLDYMYSGNIVLGDRNVYKLLKLSNHFLMDKLKGYCEQYLEGGLSLDAGVEQAIDSQSQDKHSQEQRDHEELQQEEENLMETKPNLNLIFAHSPESSSDSSNEEKVFSANSLQSSQLAWREGVKCPHCIYVGHSATRLEQHLARVHEEDTIYKCKIPNCDFTCKWNREYYKHMKIHFEGPPYKCEECDYTCDRIQFILSHRMRHTNERPFHCPECDFKSRTKGNLIVHMRKHTGEKPYQCQYCDRRFAMKNTLDQHLATHTNERPFLCDTCGFTTKYQSHLLSHKRIHTGNVYRCTKEGCLYSSPRRSQLEAHMRSHSGERVHLCSTCGRGFIEKSHLIRHSRIHLEEKPFKCDICEYGSSRRDKLKEHIFKHHTGDSSKVSLPFKPRRAAQKRQESMTCIEDNSLQDSSEGQPIIISPQEVQLTSSEQDLAAANIISLIECTSGFTPTRAVVIQSNPGELTLGESLILSEKL